MVEARLTIAVRSSEFALVGDIPFAIGRRADVNSGDESVVLVRCEPGAQPGEIVDRTAGLVLPHPLDTKLAVMVPHLAWALAIWDTLSLELGETALVTEAGAMSKLVAQVAFWRGACPVIELGSSEHVQSPSGPGFLHLDGTDPEKAMSKLALAIKDRPGFAAVEMTGRAEVVDMLLEAMPRWSRLALAGSSGTPVTIDFYKNVHQKGALIETTTLQPGTLFVDEGRHIRAQIPRAVELLRNPARARTCQQLLGIY